MWVLETPEKSRGHVVDDPSLWKWIKTGPNKAGLLPGKMDLECNSRWSPKH